MCVNQLQTVKCVWTRFDLTVPVCEIGLTRLCVNQVWSVTVCVNQLWFDYQCVWISFDLTIGVCEPGLIWLSMCVNQLWFDYRCVWTRFDLWSSSGWCSRSSHSVADTRWVSVSLRQWNTWLHTNCARPAQDAMETGRLDQQLWHFCELLLTCYLWVVLPVFVSWCTPFLLFVSCYLNLFCPMVWNCRCRN